MPASCWYQCFSVDGRRCWNDHKVHPFASISSVFRFIIFSVVSFACVPNGCQKAKLKFVYFSVVMLLEAISPARFAFEQLLTIIYRVATACRIMFPMS